MTAVDDNWPSVITNLRKSRKVWSRLLRILGREGADTRTSGRIYIAAVQETMLFGSDMWVVTPHMEHNLGGFHHRVAIWITVKLPQSQQDGIWNYPPIEESMREAGIKEM